MAPEDRRIVKGLSMLYLSFVYKEDERGMKNTIYYLGVPINGMVVAIFQDRFEL